MTLTQLLSEKKRELHEHPAMKFANDAIIQVAMRSGTKGYEGEKHLGHFLEDFAHSIVDEIKKEVIPPREKLRIDNSTLYAYWNGFEHCRSAVLQAFEKFEK